MTAYTGTVTIPGRAGEVGNQYAALGVYALTGALANTDTITWTNLLPKDEVKVVGFRYWSPELDTDATPTMTFTIGDGTDADAYLTTVNGGLPAQAPANGSQLRYEGNGVAIGASKEGFRNVVMTVTGVVATGATTGTIYVQPILEGER